MNITDRIIIWGTGNKAKEILNYFDNMKYYQDEIIAFCDNDVTKWNTLFFGYRVISPLELNKCEFDYLLIASGHEDEIKKQIKEDLPNILPKVKNEFVFKRRINTKEEYLRRGGNATLNEGKKDKSAVIYTAVTGNYDRLNDPKFISSEVQYICFTNSKQLKSDVWEIRYVENQGLSDAMLARNIKICPHRYFSECGIVYWTDAKYIIWDDLRDYKKTYWKDKKMLCFPHFFWRDICDEMACLINYRPEKKKEYIIQVADYIKDGYPTDFGSYDTGVLVRDMSDDGIVSLMDEWWKQLVKYSYRDQLSFQYLLWKENFVPDICDLYIEDNKWITVGRKQN